MAEQNGDRLDRVEATLERITERLDRMAERHERFEAAMDERLARMDERHERFEAAMNERLARRDERNDRFEAMMQADAADTHQRLEKIEAGHRELLTAQVLMADGIRTFATETRRKLDELSVKLAALAEAQRQTDQNLGVLIRMMDEWIRNNPRQ